MGEIKSSLEILDYENIRKTAHSIKGASLNLNLNLLGEISKQIEFAAAEKSSKLPTLCSQLADEWQIILHIIDKNI